LTLVGVAGTYNDEHRGPIIHVTSTEEKPSGVVGSEPHLFEKLTLRFNRRQ
jgi:hypothetical protein